MRTELLMQLAWIMDVAQEANAHLSRLADAAESPFWRLRTHGLRFWQDKDTGERVWCAYDEGTDLQGTGPTPQAAVEKFDECFKKGTP